MKKDMELTNRELKLGLNDSLLVIIADRQEIIVDDPWEEDAQQFLIPRKKGHDNWFPLAVDYHGEDGYKLFIADDKNINNMVIWFLDSEGKYQSQKRVEAPSEELNKLASNEGIWNDFLIQILIYQYGNANELWVSWILDYLKSTTKIEDDLIFFIKAVASKQIGDESDFLVMLKKKTCPDVGSKYIIRFIEKFLLANSPRYPSHAVEYIKILKEKYYINSSLEYNLNCLEARSCFYMSNFDKSLHLLEKASKEASFFRTSDVIIYCQCYLALGHIEKSLWVIRSSIEAGITNVDYMINLYINISKITSYNTDVNFLIDLIIKNKVKNDSEFLCVLALLSQSTDLNLSLSAETLSEMFDKAQEIHAIAPETIANKIWNILAEIYLDLPPSLKSKSNYQVLLEKASGSYKQQLMDFGKDKKLSQGDISLDSRKKTVALTVSGFIRSYEDLYTLRDQIKYLSQSYNVHLFMSIFDRKGDLGVPAKTPNRYVGYSNGGFIKEIEKTKFLNPERVLSILSVTKLTIESRADDEFYLDSIGIKHPQWFMVNKALELASSFRNEHSIDYCLAMRLRTDNLPSNNKALLIAAQELDSLKDKSVIYVMNKWNLGHYKLSDRLAVGTFDCIKKYGEIGAGKNFVTLEQSREWIENVRQPYDLSGGSHESHLGCWLHNNAIKFERKSYLDK